MVTKHSELLVYQKAFQAAMEIFRRSMEFPREETYSLTDQIRRSSRSVAANLAEAWRKRRYEAAFVSKLCDCEAEAAETQTWIHFARECGYLQDDCSAELLGQYEEILSMLVAMNRDSTKWILK